MRWPRFGGVRELRAIGGSWMAERVGFGSFEYEGALAGHHFRVFSRAHLTSYDDEAFEVRWHVEMDGKSIGYASWSPIATIQNAISQ